MIQYEIQVASAKKTSGRFYKLYNTRKRIIFKIALLVFKSLHGLAPQYMQELFNYVSYGGSFRLNVPITLSARYGSRAFSVVGPKIYNSLPDDVKNSETVHIFKKNLKTFLFGRNESELTFT